MALKIINRRMHCKNTGFIVSLLSAALALAVGQGCKKQPTQAAAPPPLDTNAVATATADNPAAAPEAQPPPPPPKLDFTPIQKMVQAKDYDKATEELLLLQRSVRNPTPDQSLALANQMHMLQRNLSAALAAGDPKARAAVERLNATLPH